MSPLHVPNQLILWSTLIAGTRTLGQPFLLCSSSHSHRCRHFDGACNCPEWTRLLFAQAASRAQRSNSTSPSKSLGAFLAWDGSRSKLGMERYKTCTNPDKEDERLESSIEPVAASIGARKSRTGNGYANSKSRPEPKKSRPMPRKAHTEMSAARLFKACDNTMYRSKSFLKRSLFSNPPEPPA